ncbi:MAG: hypothetical protein EHM87_23725 [Burkholderiales bacterium]|nr:MAG: hypothetical protein EHM87_23725 [Burkholderiales bacterium]
MLRNDGTVRVWVEGARATVEVHRPEALNALNRDVLESLENVAKDLALRNDISVVVLQGAGEKSFVAGADVKEMQKLSPLEAQKFSELGSRAFAAIENLPQIVVAKVQGFALGGGLELALAADFIFCSEKAFFGFPEVSLGLIPGFGGTKRFSRRVGVAKAIEWIVSGEKYCAEAAKNAGLVNVITTPHELCGRVDNIVAAIMLRGPDAIRAAKRVVRSGSDNSIAASYQLESAEFGLRFSTAEAQEGMAAFIEKRAPRFS